MNNIDEIAINLLAKKTCDNCKGCNSLSKVGTCEKWEERKDPRTDTIERIRSISNSLIQSSRFDNVQSVCDMKNEIENVFNQYASDLKTEIDVIDRGVSVTVKVPLYAEHIRVDFQMCLEVEDEN